MAYVMNRLQKDERWQRLLLGDCEIHLKNVSFVTSEALAKSLTRDQNSLSSWSHTLTYFFHTLSSLKIQNLMKVKYRAPHFAIAAYILEQHIATYCDVMGKALAY